MPTPLPTRRGPVLPSDSVGIAAQVFRDQAAALLAIADRLGREVAAAVDLILSARGRVIICGMGKSGIIGRKIAATFASTGTPSFFVHPGEAFHGDLGMIRSDDVVVLISYSGETEEVLKLLPYLQHVEAPIIALTGGANSTLARHAKVTLDVGVAKEACPNNLAPTTSTTATLAMGDALAVALIQIRGFQPHDFARFHPGGSLGRKLLTRVRDVMHRPLPSVAPEASFKEIVSAITRGRLGIVAVQSAAGTLAGVITDGDLRRAMEAHDDIRSLAARDIMSSRPVTIAEDAMFSDAEALMESRQITALIALDTTGAPSGVVKIFDVAA
ncbi:KpsF/GutQ family sugar-phosphate isomerase [Caldimonas tepidiphila]|uniref:KpsF/GutQ family sugar-phosphate isomerase n=1 Tax=Caldimonas tepidiphila TaxID=2315841 RepID=UPI000E5AE8E3|nr:KpsF/GutQ family sugar-phosphate isomerase [Caldimonas tepidiphila]